MARFLRSAQRWCFGEWKCAGNGLCALFMTFISESHIFFPKEIRLIVDIFAAPPRKLGVWYAPLPCIVARVGLDFYGIDFFRFDT